MDFKPAKAFDAKRLINHVIRVDDVTDKEFCGMLCYMEPNCVSYNLEKRPSGNDGAHKCELNDATHEGHDDDLMTDENYVYRGAEASVTLNLASRFSVNMVN